MHGNGSGGSVSSIYAHDPLPKFMLLSAENLLNLLSEFVSPVLLSGVLVLLSVCKSRLVSGPIRRALIGTRNLFLLLHNLDCRTFENYF